MGLILSYHCPPLQYIDADQQLSLAIKCGDVDAVKTLVESKHSANCVVSQTHFHWKTSPLHTAALHGKLDVLTLLLNLGADSNGRNTGDGQTPLMSACKGGSSSCVERLLQHNADALAFENTNGRTCLHIACRQGHYDCVVKVLDAARKGPISTTWGFTRFVNVRDRNGAIPLHMAARAGHAEIVRLLLNCGALITAVTCNSTYGPGHGSTPLHCAARSGSLDCVEELLAWGADRTRKDLMGHTPYAVAAQRGNMACAAILNLSAAEPMVWPSPLKFMQDLEPETRTILQAALTQVNRARNSSLLPTSAKKSKARKLLSSLCLGNLKDRSENDARQQPSRELEGFESGCITCCICFDSVHKMIEVDECGHQMCAACTMVLCCLNKPNPPASSSPPLPSCPFCRRDIARLTLAKTPSMKRVVPYTSTSTASNHDYQEESLRQLCSKRSRSLTRSISFSPR